MMQLLLLSAVCARAVNQQKPKSWLPTDMLGKNGCMIWLDVDADLSYEHHIAAATCASRGQVRDKQKAMPNNTLRNSVEGRLRDGSETSRCQAHINPKCYVILTKNSNKRVALQVPSVRRRKLCGLSGRRPKMYVACKCCVKFSDMVLLLPRDLAEPARRICSRLKSTAGTHQVHSNTMDACCKCSLIVLIRIVYT